MKNPMEHLKQWHNLYSGILTPNETAIYFQLFMIGNQRYWPEWIEITDWNLSLSTNINARTIPDVINSLVQKGLIESRRGKGKAKSGYKISLFDKDKSVVPNYEKNDVINPRLVRDKSEINPKYIRDKSEIYPRLEENSSCESKDGEAPKTRTKTMTKDKDDKKETKKEKAENIFVSCSESEKVKEMLYAFDEMRKMKKNPMTNKARELLLKKLDETSGGDEFMKIRLLEEAVEHGWLSVYPLKPDFSTVQQKKSRLQENFEAADRAIAYFESQEANRNDEGNGDSEAATTVYDGVPF